jgi:hypothetical protein
MAKPILPGVIREGKKEFFKKGYTRDAVVKFVKNDSIDHLKGGKK